MKYDFYPKTKVLIVDEYFSSAQLVAVLLCREGGYSVVAECVTAIDALKLADKYNPDIVTLPLELPGTDVIETITLLIARSFRVLIYTGTKDTQLLSAGLQTCPQGFVHKSEDISIFAQAIRHVAQGGVYFSPVCTKLGRQFRLEPKQISHEPLKSRERQILQLVAEGLSSKQIAAKLSLSKRTVEHYRLSLMQKLNLPDLTALVRYAITAGLVQL